MLIIVVAVEVCNRLRLSLSSDRDISWNMGTKVIKKQKRWNPKCCHWDTAVYNNTSKYDLVRFWQQ